MAFRRVAATSLALSLCLLVALPTLAGGAWMTSPRERVEPGEEVTLVGYAQARGLDLGQEWKVHLNLVPVGVGEESGPGGEPPQWLALAPVSIEKTRFGGYLAHRVSATVQLPSDLAPAVYSLVVRNEDGEYLIGATLNVGVEPEYRAAHEWPLDEPLIAQLPDDAVLAGPGWDITAGELRQGIYPANPEQFMLDPANLPADYQVKQPPVTTTAPAPTTTAPPTTGAEEPPSLTTSAIPPATAPLSEGPGVGVAGEESQGVLEPLALAVTLLALIGAGVVGLRRRRRENVEAVGDEEPLVRVGENR